MNRILKIGMDVHSTNYNLCVAEPKLEGEPDYLYEVEVEPDILNVIKVITNLKKSNYSEPPSYETSFLHFCTLTTAQQHSDTKVQYLSNTILSLEKRRYKEEKNAKQSRNYNPQRLHVA